MIDRIIPARAGFTAAVMVVVMTVPDHPRSRGVYMGPRHPLGGGAGSSPLARGLPRIVHVSQRQRRIIPARAGFTRRNPLWTSSAGDHPRSRGVYIVASLEQLSPVGSSPLARGLHAHGHARAARARIIPARAGFTRWSGRRRF